MSKSLGNFFTVREVLKRYHPEVVRLFILMSHYRSPLNYADTQLDAARAALTRLYTALRGRGPVEAEVELGENAVDDWSVRFRALMDDDFNTPEALAVLFELASEVNRLVVVDEARANALAKRLRALGGVLGLLQGEVEAFLRWAPATEVESGLDDAAIDALVAARLSARAARDWSESDRIRDQLAAAGVILEDGPQGTRWRRG